MGELSGTWGALRYRSWLADDPAATIVVLHGFGEHAGVYERVAERAVASGASVHALDFAGHGRSEGDRGVVPTIDGFVDDAAALVDAVDDGTPLVVVGHCLGSVVGALLVARDPGRYRSLVLTGAIPVQDRLLRTIVEADDRGALDAVPQPAMLSADPWYTDRCTDDPLMWETGFARTTLDALVDGWAKLDAARAALTLPVLAVQGTADYFIGPDTLRAWIDTLPDAQMAAFGRSRHAVLNDTERDLATDTVLDAVHGRRPRARFLPGAAPTTIASPRPSSTTGPPERRPDIILIMTDEQRHDWVGYGGDGTFETPVLDRLAASGVIFDQGYSAATTCVPARTSLLTGLHFPNAPRTEGVFALREGFWTVARGLRDAGYETAMVGRMHFTPIHADHGFETMRMCENINPGSGYGDDDVDDYRRWLADQGRPDWRILSPNPKGGEARPFDVAIPRTFPDDASLHSTAWIEREAVDVVRRRDPDRPLFLIVSFPHPHAPYDPPEPYASMYDPADTVLPVDGYEATDVLHGTFREILDGPWTHRVAASGGVDRLRSVLTAVRGLVRQIDDAVGRIVDELDLASSLLFFTSDHGDYGGNRGLFTKVPWIPYEDLLRVPLVVTGGAVARPGRRSSALVQSASFAATCLDYAGIDAPADAFDFPSLRPLLDRPDEEQAARDIVSLSYSYPTVRSGRFKLITNEQTEDALLFDLDADPRELVNRVDDPALAPLVRALRERLRYEATMPRGPRHPILAATPDHRSVATTT